MQVQVQVVNVKVKLVTVPLILSRGAEALEFLEPVLD